MDNLQKTMGPGSLALVQKMLSQSSATEPVAGFEKHDPDEKHDKGNQASPSREAMNKKGKEVCETEMAGKEDRQNLKRAEAELKVGCQKAMKEKARVQERFRTAREVAAFERQVRRAMWEKTVIEAQIRKAKEEMAALQRFLDELTKKEFHNLLQYSTKETARFRGRLQKAEMETAKKVCDTDNGTDKAELHGLFRKALKEKFNAEDLYKLQKAPIQDSLGEMDLALLPQDKEYPDQESSGIEKTCVP